MKTIKNAASVKTDNGSITFVAARNSQNLNGITYDVKSLQAQDASGDYRPLTNDWTDVSIPLMVNHSSSIEDKIGTIDSAKIEAVDGVDQVVMNAKFFNTDEAQAVRSRILEGQLSDVSITTDWGTGEDETLENAHIVEVSVVYAGAEPKAKILAKNSVGEEESVQHEDEKPAEEAATPDVPAEAVEEVTEPVEVAPEAEVVEEATEEDNTKNDKTEEVESEEGEEEVPTQVTNKVATEKVADKEAVLNSLTKLAQNGAIKNMNRNEVIAAVKNDLEFKNEDDSTYVVPDAVFTEILAVDKPTDILDTFSSVPVKRMTVMEERWSDDDAARAGRYTKGEKKIIQDSDLRAQKFGTQFLYKLQSLSYEDMQEDFGNLLLAYVRHELPQKAAEEEERAFIVGDGRQSNDDRHISSVVSLDAAAEDVTNVHVARHNGSGAATELEAMLDGIALLDEEGTTYAVMSKATLGAIKKAGLSLPNGLPLSTDTIADLLGVEKIFTRGYVSDDVAYVWTGSRVKRLTGGNRGETIEQYDIDYNERKIEFIKPVGGGATGLYSAVKVILPGATSA